MNKRMNSFLAKQSQLDKFIIQNQKLDLTETQIFTNRILAFNVEVAELANEVRSFKHWSTKKSSEKEVCLEEYVDGLHFLLSITNQLLETEKFQLNEHAYLMLLDKNPNVEFNTIIQKQPNKFDINSTFIALFSASTELYFAYLEKDSERVMDLIEDVWSIFAHLGGLLGFHNKDIDVAYDLKYKKNISRQENGY